VRALRSLRERSVFVDTSAFYALLDRSDQWNAEASRRFLRLGQEARPLFTSDLVAGETYELVRRTLGYASAIQWLQSLQINLVFQTPSDHERTQGVLMRHPESRLSYVDAASFVLMGRLEIPMAFTFDADFQRYGLEVYT
jgi:predicted nucleic acid-binding protein